MFTKHIICHCQSVTALQSLLLHIYELSAVIYCLTRIDWILFIVKFKSLNYIEAIHWKLNQFNPIHPIISVQWRTQMRYLRCGDSKVSHIRKMVSQIVIQSVSGRLTFKKLQIFSVHLNATALATGHKSFKNQSFALSIINSNFSTTIYIMLTHSDRRSHTSQNVSVNFSYEKREEISIAHCKSPLAMLSTTLYFALSPSLNNKIIEILYNCD